METVVAIKIVPLRIDPLGTTNERFNTGAEREEIYGDIFRRTNSNGSAKKLLNSF